MLIFDHELASLDCLGAGLRREMSEGEVVEFHGRLALLKREHLHDRFRNGQGISIMLSTRCGFEADELTAADHVFTGLKSGMRRESYRSDYLLRTSAASLHG